MLLANKELFEKYILLEATYKKDKAVKDELKQIKEQVLRVIQRNENKLCARSENTNHGMFSTGLADKFWTEVRQEFPCIDDSV